MRSTELFGVPETALVVLTDAVERAAADAGAALIPDGSLWRVSAGVGLRPLEHRLELAEGDWLIQTVADRNKGLLIDGSDVARARMSGAPLAARSQLLAVPIPEVRGILLLGRDGQPFEESLLTTLAALANEARPLLLDAIAARSLARALVPLTDLRDGARISR